MKTRHLQSEASEAIKPDEPSPERRHENVDVVVVGGGAAGFFAAITAKEHHPGLRVLILEKGSEVLAKVRISGGGRCNVTHACFDAAELTTHYPRGHRELLGPFHRWQPSNTVQWFEERDVALKTEEDGRMFPVSDRSSSIVTCLTEAARRADVKVRTGLEVRRVRPLTAGGFILELRNAPPLRCRRVLWSAGGMKAGPTTDMFSRLGHHIVEPIPSLFTFKVRDPLIEGLQGLSVEEVTAQLVGSKIRCEGPLLITHWGLSGPAILRLSAWAARELHASKGSLACTIRWVAHVDDPMQALKTFQSRHPKKQVSNTSPFSLPKRLWQRMLASVNHPTGRTWCQMNRAQLETLTNILMCTRFKVIGKSRNKDEFVTCGGVHLREIDFKTMESKILPGLYFAGEALDVDAETGGFNFQAAWTTGYLAGRAMAQRF
jgi:predicted Rossmann fold flavoprotein